MAGSAGFPHVVLLPCSLDSIAMSGNGPSQCAMHDPIFPQRLNYSRHKIFLLFLFHICVFRRRLCRGRCGAYMLSCLVPPNRVGPRILTLLVLKIQMRSDRPYFFSFTDCLSLSSRVYLTLKAFMSWYSLIHDMCGGGDFQGEIYGEAITQSEHSFWE